MIFGIGSNTNAGIVAPLMGYFPVRRSRARTLACLFLCNFFFFLAYRQMHTAYVHCLSCLGAIRLSCAWSPGWLKAQAWSRIPALFSHRCALVRLHARATTAIAHAARVQECPLSATVLVADVKAPDFNGNITYKWLPDAPADVTASGRPDDMRYCDWTEVSTGDVAYYATGAPPQAMRSVSHTPHCQQHAARVEAFLRRPCRRGSGAGGAGAASRVARSAVLAMRVAAGRGELA